MKTSYLCLMALLAMSHSVLADIQYTSVLSTFKNGAWKPLNSTTTYLKKGVKREDLTQKIGTFERTEATISHIKGETKILFDPDLKIYTTQDGSPLPQSEILPAGVAPAGKGKGKMVLTLSAQFVGNEKLLGRAVRHSKTSMETESSGCCGTVGATVKSEIWTAGIELPDEPPSLQPGDEFLSSTPSKCDVTIEHKGDTAAFRVATKSFALKRIVFDADGAPSTLQQVASLSNESLSDDQFVVPADFKELSLDEYNEARSAALSAAIVRMTGNG